MSVGQNHERESDFRFLKSAVYSATMVKEKNGTCCWNEEIGWLNGNRICAVHRMIHQPL